MKIFDKLFEIFIKLFEIVLYSMVFPVSLGIIILFLYPVAIWFVGHGFIGVYGTGFIVGLYLLYLKNKRNFK